MNIESSNASSIVLGCFVAVVSSAIQSLGITLQRKSHLLPIHLHDEDTNTSYHHSMKQKKNMWLFGFLLFIVSNILGSLIQITTLPLIILSPLQSIGLIFNSLLSCMLLPGEKFTWKLATGTAVIAVGAFIIAYNGSAVPPPDNNTDVNTRFKIIITKLTHKKFATWFTTTFVVILLLLAFNLLITLRRNALKEKLKVRQKKAIIRILDKLQFIKGINFGVISGTLTAHTFLFAKSLIDVIFETIMNNKHDLSSITTNITPYLLLIIMFTIVGFQLTAFNLGLAEISTSILYPLCFLVYNLINLINDLTFNDLIKNKQMTWGQLVWVLIGLVGVLFGVVLISWDSAVGTSLKTLSGSGESEDDHILHTKFPYTDANERTSLMDESSYELDSNYFATESTYLHPHSIYPASRPVPQKKRVLSYEQQQLLHQLQSRQ